MNYKMESINQIKNADETKSTDLGVGLGRLVVERVLDFF